MREVALQDALKDLTIYNTLDRAEFERFVCRFDSGLHGTYKMEFSQLDACSSEPRRGTMISASLLGAKQIWDSCRKTVYENLHGTAPARAR